jgi:hypothetical protein
VMVSGPPTAADAVPPPGRTLEGYPEEWPVVALLVKVLAGWRCEHCGTHLPHGGAGDEALTVHHLDGRPDNLYHWNLIALCLRDHALVERSVHLDVDQLELLDAPLFPWLEARRRQRELYPYRPSVPVVTADSTAATPASGEEAGYRSCACGCGRPVPPSRRGEPRRYATRACQQRAYRDRLDAQGSLLALLADGDRGCRPTGGLAKPSQDRPAVPTGAGAVDIHPEHLYVGLMADPAGESPEATLVRQWASARWGPDAALTRLGRVLEEALENLLKRSTGSVLNTAAVPSLPHQDTFAAPPPYLRCPTEILPLPHSGYLRCPTVENPPGGEGGGMALTV